jgi:hypothetical protein
MIQPEYRIRRRKEPAVLFQVGCVGRITQLAEPATAATSSN